METIEKLKEITKEIILLENCISTIAWDQETYMPSKAIGGKGEQLALLQGLLHQKFTSGEMGDFLKQTEGGGEASQESEDPADESGNRAFLRELKRQYGMQTKLSGKLVRDLARETSLSQAAWIESRKNSDYSVFKPHLDRLLDLTREKAEAIGYENSPYDALMDEFEPWSSTAEIKSVFDNIQPWLSSFAAKIRDKNQVDDSFLHLEYDPVRQESFGRRILRDMGYDFEAGRLDVSAHPFTTTLGPDDVRITTRYERKFFNAGIFGIIHEGGHALYELGFSEKLKGNILAQGASFGIHESQSRTWENIIGRSLHFWKHYYPVLQDYFPENLGKVSLDSFYKGINKVEPSLIRVEADEVTYNLHIILRFNLEQALISGDLDTADLPDAWNSETEKLLGIRPENDREGVLQDIHWAMGAFGYFPSYALGNLYGAQFSSAMKKKIRFKESLESGDLLVPLKWLRENIHQYGALKPAGKLTEDITGEKLNPAYFREYLEQKYSVIYDL